MSLHQCCQLGLGWYRGVRGINCQQNGTEHEYFSWQLGKMLGDDDHIERLYDDLYSRVKRHVQSCDAGLKDITDLDREQRTCSDKLRALTYASISSLCFADFDSATLRGEDKLVQQKWTPRLRSIQEFLKEGEQKLASLRSSAISSRTLGSAGPARAQPSLSARAIGSPMRTVYQQPEETEDYGATTQAQVVQERETTQIARSMVRTVVETNEVSAATLVALHNQGTDLHK